jgi:hypothetical protein
MATVLPDYGVKAEKKALIIAITAITVTTSTFRKLLTI